MLAGVMDAITGCRLVSARIVLNVIRGSLLACTDLRPRVLPSRWRAFTQRTSGISHELVPTGTKSYRPLGSGFAFQTAPLMCTSISGPHAHITLSTRRPSHFELSCFSGLLPFPYFSASSMTMSSTPSLFGCNSAQLRERAGLNIADCTASKAGVGRVDDDTLKS